MGIGGAAVMPVDPVDHLQRLRPARARPGHRRLGRRGRPRRGDRPDRRRRAAGALLVGLGLPDQRAGRGGRRGAGRRCWCRSRGTPSPGRIDVLGVLLSIVGLVAAGLRHHRRRRARLRPARRSGPRSLGGVAVLACVRLVRAAQRPPVAGRAAVPATRGSPPRSAIGRPGLLRRDGRDVLQRLLPAAGARLQPAAGRPAASCRSPRPSSSSPRAARRWSSRFGAEGGLRGRPGAGRGRRWPASPSSARPPRSGWCWSCFFVQGVGHGQRHAAGHRVDHVGAAPGEGRRRLGGQQHRPPGRRRARRRGARLGALRGLPRRDRRRPDRRCPARPGTAAGESISGAYAVAAQARSGRPAADRARPTTRSSPPCTGRRPAPRWSSRPRHPRGAALDAAAGAATAPAGRPTPVGRSAELAGGRA